MRHIEGFKLLDEVSRNRFSVLYRAKETEHNCLIFVRLFLSPAPNAESHYRYYNETTILGILNPPYFQQLLPIGPLQPYYQALEYFEGTPLDRVLTGAKIARESRTRLARDMAIALNLAHCFFIAHCNLRASNVILTGEDKFKIIGLEYGKILHGPSTLVTARLPNFHIPPDAITPEQRAGLTGEIGLASDIYAWAVILYQLMNWVPGFPAEEIEPAILALSFGHGQKVSGLLPNCSPELDAIFVKCLQSNPSDRYQNAGALLEDLRKVPGWSLE